MRMAKIAPTIGIRGRSADESPAGFKVASKSSPKTNN